MSLSPEKKAWLVLGAVFILCLLLNIDYSAVNLILVDVSRDFDEDLNVLQWLLSAYTLAWGSLAIIGGRLSDLYGRRHMFFIGVSIFAVASLLCGIAWDTWVVILGRVLQGVGGGLFISPLYAIIFMEFPENKRGLAIGSLGVACGIGLAFGPSMAGTLLEILSWRWVFYVNIPLCIAAIWVMARFTEKDVIEDTDQKIDYQGAGLLAAFIISLLYTINQGEVWGLNSALFLGGIAASIALFAVFLLHQRNRKNRLIPEGFFRNTPYLGCLFSFSLFEYVFATTLLVINLYLQNVLNYSPYDSGIIFFAMTLSLGVLSPFGGKLSDIMDPRVTICSGLFLLSIACIWAATFTMDTSLTSVLIALSLIGIGMGLSFPPLNAVMMKTVAPNLLNTASGVFSVGTCISLSLGVILSSSLLTGLGQQFLQDMMPATLTAQEQSTLMVYIAGAHQDIADLAGFADPQAMSTLVKMALTEAMMYSLLIASAVSFIAGCLSLTMIRNIGSTEKKA